MEWGATMSARHFFYSILSITVFYISTATANIAGTHLQNFNPTVDGLGYVTVQSAETLPPGVFNFSLFSNYAWNSLPFYKLSTIPLREYSEPKNKLWSADLGLALGVTENWQIGVATPIVLDQSMNSSTTLGSFDDQGVTEIKLHTKYRFWNEDGFTLAATASANFDRITNNPYTGNDPGPTINLDIVGEYKIDGLQSVASNLGYRLRNQGELIPDTGVGPLSDQITYSVGYSYFQEPWDTRFIFELFGALATDSTALPTQRRHTSLEALAGAKYQWEKFTFHGGLTTKILDGLASPDFRIYLGMGFQFGPFWAEKSTPAPIAAPTPPAPIIATEDKPSETIVLSSINFATNSIKMQPASQLAFEKTLQSMREKSNTIRKLVIEGHTDDRGTDAFNLRLGQGRANTVRGIILAQLNLPSEQVTAVGIGESQPIAPNTNDNNRAKNRRVEIKIYRNF